MPCCRLTKPDEIYNLGAQSHVQVSFELPQYTAEASGVVGTRSAQVQGQRKFRCFVDHEPYTCNVHIHSMHYRRLSGC